MLPPTASSDVISVSSDDDFVPSPPVEPRQSVDQAEAGPPPALSAGVPVVPPVTTAGPTAATPQRQPLPGAGLTNGGSSIGGSSIGGSSSALFPATVQYPLSQSYGAAFPATTSPYPGLGATFPGGGSYGGSGAVLGMSGGSNGGVIAGTFPLGYGAHHPAGVGGVGAGGIGVGGVGFVPVPWQVAPAFPAPPVPGLPSWPGHTQLYPVTAPELVLGGLGMNRGVVGHPLAPLSQVTVVPEAVDDMDKLLQLAHQARCDVRRRGEDFPK